MVRRTKKLGDAPKNPALSDDTVIKKMSELTGLSIGRGKLLPYLLMATAVLTMLSGLILLWETEDQMLPLSSAGLSLTLIVMVVFASRHRSGVLLLAACFGVPATLMSLLFVLLLSHSDALVFSLMVTLALLGLTVLLWIGLHRSVSAEKSGGKIIPIAVLWSVFVFLGFAFGAASADDIETILASSMAVTGVATVAAFFLRKGTPIPFGFPRHWLHFLWPLASALVLAWTGAKYSYLLVHHLGPDTIRAELLLRNVSLEFRILGLVVFVPLLEETLFRGVFQGVLRSVWKPTPAILATALLFALAHMNPLQLPVLFVAGLTLGLAREHSGSLLPCILMHMLFNFLAVL